MTFYSNPNSNHDKVLRAAVNLCAQLGRDKLTMSMIAKEAGVSRGTLYNKFENVDGVLAEIWLEAGAGWLDRLERRAPSEIPEALEKCLAQCITVAPRAPAILEIIEVDIVRLFQRAGAQGRASEAQLAWIMALALGQRFAEQSQLTFNFEMMAGFSDLIAQMPSDWPGDFSPPEHNYPPLQLATTTDDRYDRILTATVLAVTRSGIANASMARICRSARVSPGVVLPRFVDYDTLIITTFNALVEAVVSENLEVYAPSAGESMAEQFASSIVASFSPSRKAWRDFRREIYFALPTEPQLVEPILAGFKRTDVEILKILLDAEMPAELANAVTEWNQMAGVGLSILSDLGVPVRSLNHFAVSSWMTSLLNLA